MLLAFRLSRQAAGDARYRIISSSVPCHLGPVQNGPYQLPDATSSFGFRQPDRRQDRQNLRGVDIVDERIFQNRERVCLERVDLLSAVLFVFPSLLMLPVNQASSFGKSGHSP